MENKVRNLVSSLPLCLSSSFRVSTLQNFGEDERQEPKSRIKFSLSLSLSRSLRQLLGSFLRNTAPRDQKSESSHPGTSYSPRQLADEGKVTRTKGKAVQNDLEMKGSCSVLFDEALGSSCPGNNEGRGKANGITQMQAIAKNALQGSCGTEEMSPQALLFRSLWLKAEAALSFFNYQASASNVSK